GGLSEELRIRPDGRAAPGGAVEARQEDVHRAAGRGGAGAVYRMRQRREPAAGAAAETRKGAGAAAGPGSEQVPVDAATVDRKHAALDRGGSGGAGARAVRAAGPGEVRRAVHDTCGGGQDRRAGSAL